MIDPLIRANKYLNQQSKPYTLHRHRPRFLKSPIMIKCHDFGKVIKSQLYMNSNMNSNSNMNILLNNIYNLGPI